MFHTRAQKRHHSATDVIFISAHYHLILINMRDIYITVFLQESVLERIEMQDGV